MNRCRHSDGRYGSPDARPSRLKFRNIQASLGHSLGVISLSYLKAIEGQQVDVMLTDGTRLTGWTLVSVGRLWARTVWLVDGETDVFVGPDEISDIRVPERLEAA